MVERLVIYRDIDEYMERMLPARVRGARSEPCGVPAAPPAEASRGTVTTSSAFHHPLTSFHSSSPAGSLLGHTTILFIKQPAQCISIGDTAIVQCWRPMTAPKRATGFECAAPTSAAFAARPDLSSSFSLSPKPLSMGRSSSSMPAGKALPLPAKMTMASVNHLSRTTVNLHTDVPFS